MSFLDGDMNIHSFQLFPYTINMRADIWVIQLNPVAHCPGFLPFNCPRIYLYHLISMEQG